MRSEPIEREDGCLGTETLIDFYEGRAEGPVREHVEHHASRCDSCREVLSSLGRDHTPHLVDAQVADRELAPGTQIGRYVIAHRRGAGGMGIVYAAHDPELDRMVAIKVLRGDRGPGLPGLQERLRREAQAMARLAHPHVVAVYDAGVFDDRMFIAMELIDGETLAHWLATPRSQREILDACRAAGSGLAAGHDAGIVHRDFKPENVLVGKDGRVRVGDFGLARPTASRDAAPGGVDGSGTVGTPSYMAPEVFGGVEADARSDQFSFSVTLYTALYGERPFAGDSLAALSANVRAGKRRTPRAAHQVPRRIRRAIERGLAVEPAARFGSLHKMLDQLAPRPRPAARWVIALGVALTAAIGLLVSSARSETPEPCGGGAAAFGSIWNAGHRAALEAAFVASGKPYAASSLRQVAGVLDRYAVSWTRGYRAACRATRVLGVQSDAMLDLRMTCLERRRKDASALITTLKAGGPEAVLRSSAAAFGLANVDDCAELAALRRAVAPPDDRATRIQLEALTWRLAEIRAKHAIGAYDAALAPVREVVRAAVALDYRPFTAEAELLQGRIETAEGDYAAAETTLHAAVWSAEAGRNDEVAAEAWSQLVSLVGYHKGEFAPGLAFVPRATAAIARLGDRPDLESALELGIGSIDFKQAKFGDAASHEAKALALAERAFGGEHLNVAKALESLGTTTSQQGQLAEGIQLLQRAHRIYEHVLGPDHPWVARVLHNLGTAHLQMRDSTAAEPELRRALVIRETTLGPDHPDLAATACSLAAVLEQRGRLDDALPLYRRAVAIAELTSGPGGLDLVAPLLYLGGALGRAGTYADADATLRRAHTLAGQTLGAEHPFTMVIIAAQASVLLRRAHWREAAALDERALPILEKTQGLEEALVTARTDLGRAYVELRRPARALVVLAPLANELAAQPADVRAEAEFTMARARWDAGGDRGQARSLARRALADLTTAARPASVDAARIERWLASHPAP